MPNDAVLNLRAKVVDEGDNGLAAQRMPQSKRDEKDEEDDAEQSRLLPLTVAVFGSLADEGMLCDKRCFEVGQVVNRRERCARIGEVRTGKGLDTTSLPVVLPLRSIRLRRFHEIVEQTLPIGPSGWGG